MWWGSGSQPHAGWVSWKPPVVSKSCGKSSLSPWFGADDQAPRSHPDLPVLQNIPAEYQVQKAGPQDPQGPAGTKSSTKPRLGGRLKVSLVTLPPVHGRGHSQELKSLQKIQDLTAWTPASEGEGAELRIWGPGGTRGWEMGG